MKKLLIAALAGSSLLLAGCGLPEPSTPTYQREQRQVESNQRNLAERQPVPQLETSLERANLIERLQRINQENMSGCIYLISYGSIMAYYPVRGKVTSLNAYLSASEQIVDDPNGSYDAGSVTVEMPDSDGAYGKNADGIFFFTADTNAYVEWAGDYLWSDQCLRPSREPLMVRQITE